MFDKNDNMIEFSPSGVLYSATFEELANSKIVNWAGNRPPDELRIPEIVNSILKRKHVHDYIKVAMLKDREFSCYDGSHRLEAIKGIVKSHPDLKNYKCTVYVMKDATEGKVTDDFLEINKSISVPEIYRESSPNSERKKVIEETVKHFYDKYKKELFRSSKKTQIPRENRERFTERVTSLYDELDSPAYQILVNFLYRLSDAYRVNIDWVTMTEDKCRICIDAGFWLFTKKDWHVYQRYGLTKEQLLK